MDNSIETIFGTAEVEPIVANVDEKVAAKKEFERKGIEAFKDELKENPELEAVANTLVPYIRVTKTIASAKAPKIKINKDGIEPKMKELEAAKDPKVIGKDGKVNEALLKKEARNKCLVSVPGVVGYQLKNESSETIKYQTDEYVLNKETNEYVGTTVEKDFKPGTEIILDKKNMTLFCADPRLSNKLANGKIAPSSSLASAIKNNKQLSFDETMRAYHFSFDKAEDGTTPTVDDDEIKVVIDSKDGKILKEYIPTFGYLLNPKEAKKAGRKGSGKSKFDNQTYAAAFVRKLARENSAN